MAADLIGGLPIIIGRLIGAGFDRLIGRLIGIGRTLVDICFYYILLCWLCCVCSDFFHSNYCEIDATQLKYLFWINSIFCEFYVISIFNIPIITQCISF